MRNPYKLYMNEPLENILLKAMVFPGAAFAHVRQINRESNLPLKSRVNNYLGVSLVEVLKLAACGMAIHNGYELYQYASLFSW